METKDTRGDDEEDLPGRGGLRTRGPPSVWRRGRPLHVEAGRPCPSRETTCWQERNAHLELKALQRQAPCSPAPQVWELSERGGRGGTLGKGRGLWHQTAPLPPPSVSHQLSGALTILLPWGLGHVGPGPRDLSSPACAPPPSHLGPLGVGLRAGRWAGKGPGKHHPRYWSLVPSRQTSGAAQGTHTLLGPGRLTPQQGPWTRTSGGTPRIPSPSAQVCRPYFPRTAGLLGRVHAGLAHKLRV